MRMRNDSPVSFSAMELLLVKVALRIAVIVVSGILIVVSAITVGIVNSNDDFDRLGQFSKSLESIRQLETLVENTLSTAAWLLVLSGVVLVWEGVFSAVPVVLSRLGFLQRYSVLLTITDAVFSCLTAVCALASTITSVVLADAWGEPPEACDQYSRYYKSLDCDHNHLEGTNGTAALLCTGQVVLLSILGLLGASGCLPMTVVSLKTPRPAPGSNRAIMDTE